MGIISSSARYSAGFYSDAKIITIKAGEPIQKHDLLMAETKVTTSGFHNLAAVYVADGQRGGKLFGVAMHDADGSPGCNVEVSVLEETKRPTRIQLMTKHQIQAGDLLVLTARGTVAPHVDRNTLAGAIMGTAVTETATSFPSPSSTPSSSAREASCTARSS